MADLLPQDDEEEVSSIDAVFTPEYQGMIFFRGKPILTARLPDKQGYVVLRSLADAFGLSRTSFINRLKRRGNYFSQYVCKITIMTKGGPQAQLCMNAHAVPLFISTASVEAVKDPAARELLTAFIQECHAVLAEHFGISEQGEMEVMRSAMARMVIEREAEDRDLAGRDKTAYVDQQIARLKQENDEKVGQIRKAFGELRGQIKAIAATPNVERLTPEQVGQINMTVRTLGYLLQERGIPNPYQRIYSNIFRMTGVGATERIRQADFEMVIGWMEQQIVRINQSPKLSPDQADDLADKLLGD